jgi:hypothetical protein
MAELGLTMGDVLPAANDPQNDDEDKKNKKDKKNVKK